MRLWRLPREQAQQRRLGEQLKAVPGMVSTVTSHYNSGLIALLTPAEKPDNERFARYLSILPTLPMGWKFHWYTRPVGKMVMIADSLDFPGLVVVATEK